MKENEVEKIMRLLDCTEEEAKDVIKTDKMIDKGERTPYDLSKEDEKKALKLANAYGLNKKAPTVYNFNKRERKKNTIKIEIVEALKTFLEKNYQEVEILNPDRLISFKLNDKTYELTLVEKRAKKK